MLSVEDGTLSHPPHLRPVDFLHFVELDEFSDDWKALGLDLEQDLFALQIAIMANPEGAPVIQGTGGLRKLRFAPVSWGTGKSGAVRVAYVYFKQYWFVLLVLAYGKNEQGNLTAEEKAGIKKYIARTEKWLYDQYHRDDSLSK